MRTRLFVPAGISLHDTLGDSLAPLHVYTSGRAAPGLSESTVRVNVPDDPADCAGCWPDCAGWEDPDRDCGVDTDVVDVHPPKITSTDRITAMSMNQRICITGHVHPG
jgi:hypothetical protein